MVPGKRRQFNVILILCMVIAATTLLLNPVESLFFGNLRRDIARRRLEEILLQFPGILYEVNMQQTNYAPPNPMPPQWNNNRQPNNSPNNNNQNSIPISPMNPAQPPQMHPNTYNQQKGIY